VIIQIFSELTEAWRYAFFRNALLAGMLTALLCSLLSIFVVERNLAFAGVGIAHCTFGGLALGVALGLDPILIGTVFGVLVAAALGRVTVRRSRLKEDAAIGIAFAASMAFGVLVVSTSPEVYYGELFGFLFGNILTVSTRDLMTLLLLGIIVAGFVAFFFKELLLMCVNEEIATVQGIPTKMLHYLLMCSIALTVVVTIQLIGIILASGLLVIPAATGKQMVDHYRGIMLIAVVSSLVATVSGLAISYLAGWPSGATVVLIASGIFAAAAVIGRVRDAGLPWTAG